jgi:hypothetical protein
MMAGMIEARYTLDERPLAEMRRRAAEALKRAAVHVWAAVQRTLNVPNTGVRKKRLQGKGSRTTYPSPSAPGQPPRKRTGWLQRNVLYAVDAVGLSAKVGVSAGAAYGIDLEVGTRKMAARPWLFRTASAEAANVRKIIALVMSGGGA